MSALVAIAHGTSQVDSGQALAALLRSLRCGSCLVSDLAGDVISEARELGVVCEPSGGFREYRCYLMEG